VAPENTIMTHAEKRIWEAAFGAAFVREFYDELHLRQSIGKGGYDDTKGDVERAMDVADKAVAELRRWVKQEGTEHFEYTKTIATSE